MRIRNLDRPPGGRNWGSVQNYFRPTPRSRASQNGPPPPMQILTENCVSVSVYGRRLQRGARRGYISIQLDIATFCRDLSLSVSCTVYILRSDAGKHSSTGRPDIFKIAPPMKPGRLSGSMMVPFSSQSLYNLAVAGERLGRSCG